MIIFRAKRWLDENEFKEILKIADYSGYDKHGAIFKFNFDKAIRNGYGYEDVVLLLQEYGLEVDENELEEIRRLYEGIRIRIEWDRSTGSIKLRIPWRLYYRVRDLIKNIGARYIGKNEREIMYRLLPNKLYLLIDELNKNGVYIDDPENLLEDKPLPTIIELRNIELRSYQREALDKWIENNYSGIIALPTGSGKTIIGIAALTVKPVRTLIITYTREQMFQWRDSILRYTTIGVGMVGLMYSGEKRLAPITITTYQSGFRLINDIAPYFNMLIVDEVHHLPADKFKYIALHSLAKYKMGLSATPIREDGKHEELFPLLGGIIYYRSPAELVQMGYLARYKIYTVRVGLTRKEQKEFETLRRKYRALIGSASFQEVLEAARKGDERAKEALKIHSQIRMLLAKSESKIDKAVEIAKKELERGGKIIVFTQYVEQAKKISEKLGAYLLTGEVPVETRKNVLRRFKETDSGILVVTTVGDEGLDIPDANVGIIVSGTGSRRQFIQRLGRLLRPKEGDVEAKLYEIVLEKTPEEYHSWKRKKIDLDEFLV